MDTEQHTRRQRPMQRSNNLHGSLIHNGVDKSVTLFRIRAINRVLPGTKRCLFLRRLNNNRLCAGQIDSKMVCIGDDQTYTAMAKTVGLPVAMATLQILNGKIKTPGVQLPINKEVYLPILKELEEYGVIFNEKQMDYLGYNPDRVKH